MILVDTSAWVDFDRQTGSVPHLAVRRLIASDGPLVVTDPVIMEVLAGARDDVEELRLSRLLARFELLPFAPAVDFDSASGIFRRCRTRGVTPRSLVHCMIASVAMRTGASILANDADFSRMAEVVALDLDPATPSE